jgi:RNA polymerase sigma factor (sigma-70 family)
VTTTEPHPDILADRADDPIGEELLLQAVRDGSTGAFGILYARYRPLAVGIARQALPSGEVALAEDVVELAFIRVLTALRNGKGPTDSLRAYLTTTIRREAWRSQSRRRRQAEVVDRWAAGEATATPAPDLEPDKDLGSHVLLGEAFRGLSSRWRHVLWLTVVEGRKAAEVAPMLGVSASTASALSYRARNGLIAAYIGAYRRSTDDPTCIALAPRLERYVAAGAPDDGFADVVAHLDGCRRCREVSRGIDVLGSVLASMAPFGLLTAGWWAQGAGIGAAGLAAGAAAATAATATTAASTTAASGGAAAGGLGVGGAVAAAAAVVVVAGAAWFGVIRSDPPEPQQSARITTSTVLAAGRGSSPEGTARPVATTAVAPAPAPAPVGSSVPVATTEPVRPTRPPATPTTVARSGPTAPPPTSAPTTTAPTSTRPTSTSTSTTTVPVRPGALTGRASDATAPEAEVPVSGIAVVAYDDAGRLAGSTHTSEDGRWSIPDLAAGRYFVVAVVPARYRPATGDDPWTGGSTWGAVLGEVQVVDRPLDLVDLRLVAR